MPCTAIALAIKKSGADILGTYMANPPDLAIFAKQLRQLGVKIQWIGSPSIIGVSALNLAGDALHGTYGVTDAGGTAIIPPGGASASMGIAKLSDDGKTITFPNTVTGFVITYYPRAAVDPDTASAYSPSP